MLKSVEKMIKFLIINRQEIVFAKIFSFKDLINVYGKISIIFLEGIFVWIFARQLKSI